MLSSSEVTNEDQASKFHTLEGKYITGPSIFEKMRQRNRERERLIGRLHQPHFARITAVPTRLTRGPLLQQRKVRVPDGEGSEEKPKKT